ncbi:hypothetical protein MSG28_015075 [Choristoneura fumiferana]|uniref:Uncharacterized protein n=1 Tax=Choristoneura fumiferana TaxID=7141 RepID=A0ACC0KZ51_CHOFU|nr:hypothetical protein MSG28_015075 [Choristoneura fumiferana]
MTSIGTGDEHTHSLDNISDSELESVLRKRGSDFDAMLQNHKEQKQFEHGVARSLKEMGREVEMASRLTYNDELIKWCDVVVPCGGDGTFLLAASRVRDAEKPVIGFNSAPHKSVGRLCLPTWCSNDVKGALHALKEGRFRWMRRSRIRTTITCEPKFLDTITPVDLHTLHYSRYPAVVHPHDSTDAPTTNEQFTTEERKSVLHTKVLPFLALNEVFIGESVTSRVSLLRLQIDKGAWTHTKSSGLCVTTGTGSTSWHFSINCLRTHSVLELMKILSEEGVKVDTTLEKAREIAERYNQRLMFPPESDKLAYSVREYITFEEWPAPRGLRVRDRAAAVRVRSHCVDAGLVIDGSVSFPFNDGTEALLEIHPEDALMTVHMDDALPY